MSLAAPISPSLLPNDFSSSFLLSYQASSQSRTKPRGCQGTNGRKRGTLAAGSSASAEYESTGASGENNSGSDSTRPTKFPRLTHEVMVGNTALVSTTASFSLSLTWAHAPNSPSHLPFVRTTKQRERKKSIFRSSSFSVASTSKLPDFPSPFPINSNGDPDYPSWLDYDPDPFAATQTLLAESKHRDSPKAAAIAVSLPNNTATASGSSSTCVDTTPSLPTPPTSKPATSRTNCRPPSLPRNPSASRSSAIPLCSSPLSRDADDAQHSLASLSPMPIDARLPRPRSKPGPNLLKQAIKTRMLATPEGKKVIHMGARLAVSIGEATKELERMVQESQARDVERSPASCPVDAVDWDGDAVMMDETPSSSTLSKSWIVIPGEDWEMVDCGA